MFFFFFLFCSGADLLMVFKPTSLVLLVLFGLSTNNSSRSGSPNISLHIYRFQTKSKWVILTLGPFGLADRRARSWGWDEVEGARI